MTAVDPAVPVSEPEAKGLRKAVERGLRRCRVEDGSPVSLIRESDLHHVTHMVVAELLAAHTPEGAEGERVTPWIDSLRSAHAQGPNCYLPEGWHAAVGRLLTAIDAPEADPTAGERVHWVGEHNNTLHGNGAGSKDMERTSGDEDEGAEGEQEAVVTREADGSVRTGEARRGEAAEQAAMLAANPEVEPAISQIGQPEEQAVGEGCAYCQAPDPVPCYPGCSGGSE